ncbi:MAG: hypothetical protein MJE77_33105 [Proteobacteria bacterium]|nr:hypothetical protein [Pseudomonadota bacterium]
MAIQEQHGLAGQLTIVVRDRAGREVDRRWVKNRITTVGKTLLAQIFGGVAVGKPTLAIAVGTGGPADSEGQVAAPADGDTTLVEQLDQALASVLPVRTENAAERPKVIATVTATLPVTPDGSEQALREAGILITLPNQEPVLYNRVTFPTVTRTGNLQLTLTWEVSF